MALTTATEKVEGRVPITVLTLEGELDASNFERLVDDVGRLYEGGTRHLLIDMTGLTFLASSGLVALHNIVRVLHGEETFDPDAGWGAFHSIDADLEHEATQREVQLAGPQPAVARVLQRTGLDGMFVIHSDRASGIAGF
jgi:anti-anti-sigma factor